MLRWILIWCLLLVGPIFSTQAPSFNRIVSLSPVITEIVYALGAESRLAGVTTHCDYPASANTLPKIGDHSPNYEALVSLAPDLILGLGTPKTTLKRLDLLGLSYTHFDAPATVEGLFDLIEQLADQLGVSAAGLELAESLRARLPVLDDGNDLHPTVLVVIWGTPLMAAGPDSFLSDMIRYAGGQPVLSGRMEAFPTLAPESVLALDPDVIVFTQQRVLKQLHHKPYIRHTTAAKKGRLYADIDPDLLVRAGPRIVDGILALKEVLYVR